MKKNPVRSVIFLIILFAITLPSPGMFAAQRADESSFEKFLANPSRESWDSLEADIHAGRYGPRTGLFQQVLEYHDARMHRDYSVSMALVGITPNQFGYLQDERVESAFGSIRAQESPDLWRLLEKMAALDFNDDLAVSDDDLAWTAFEIADRLSPARFAMIAQEVVKLHPERARFIKIVREDWEDPFHKFLADPSQASWQSLETDIHAGNVRSTFRQILQYHDARRDRDRPGQEGSSGCDPAIEVEQAFEIIRKDESFYSCQLLGKMAVQDFDDELAWTACEIAARLSEAKFRKIAEEVGRVHPERMWLIDLVSEKWLKPVSR